MKGWLVNPIRAGAWALILLIVALALRNLIPSGTEPAAYTFDQFIRQLVFGLAQGSIYALIALGYTLIYSVLSIVNFAHGEVFMAGAYLGFFTMAAAQESGMLASSPLLALLLTLATAMVASVVVALLLERFAFRRLREAPRLVSLITAVGVSIVLQQVFVRLFGEQVRRYPDVQLYALPTLFPQLGCADVEGQQVCRGIDLMSGRYDVILFGIEIRLLPIHFVVIFVALVLMTLLWIYMTRTRAGVAMRAVAENRSYAALVGIPVNRVIVMTFVLSALLAGAAGVLFALYNQQVTPYSGFLPGIKALTAAILGGLGNAPGAVVSGFVLGVVEAIAPSMLGVPTQLRDAVALVLLVLVLIFRPEGILGEAAPERRY
jgi:branched-chain amino acid transport system permease protein